MVSHICASPKLLGPVWHAIRTPDGEAKPLGLGKQDEFSARSVMVASAASKLKYALDARGVQIRVAGTLVRMRKTVDQHHAHHDQYQPHYRTPFQRLLK